MAVLKLGVDFGTSHIAILKLNKGVVLQEPTIVALDAESSELKVLEIGRNAKKMVGKASDKVALVSPVQEGTIKNIAVASEFLKACLLRVVGDEAPSRIDAVFSVPCGSTPEERNKLQEAAYNAGISNLQFVPAVIATALHEGWDITSSRSIMIVSIGGGNTDIGVIALSRIVEGCSVNIGGGLMDKITQELIMESKGLEVGIMSAERIKKEVASLYSNDISTSDVSGIDVVTKTPRADKISAKELNAAVQGFYLTIVAAMQNLINLCSPDVVADLTENGAIVCGGDSKILGLEQFLSKRLNIPVRVSEKPELCTVLGLSELIKNEELLCRVIREN